MSYNLKNVKWFAGSDVVGYPLCKKKTHPNALI